MHIVLNKTETKRMLNVKSALEEMWNGKLRKYCITPYTAKDIAMVYSCIIHDISHCDSTINDDTKHFFEKMGFLIENITNGNGWNIYISKRMKELYSNRK